MKTSEALTRHGRHGDMPMGVMLWLRTLMLALIVALAAIPVLAQDGAGAAGEDAGPDYKAWQSFAEQVDARLADDATSDAALDELRNGLVEWRTTFQSAQATNASRIGTVKEQIQALGPAPEDGESEVAELAERRQDLGELLARLQAPVLTAEEAYRRADGLIRALDRNLRDRQANQLLQLWPSPVNPANWPEALIGLSDTFIRIWNEGAGAWDRPRTSRQFFDNLPLTIFLLAVSLAAMIFARRWIELFSDRLRGGSSAAGRQILAIIASLGEVVVPVVGVVAFSAALGRTGLLGALTGAIVNALPYLGVGLFGAIWLGGRAFPRVERSSIALPLPPELRGEGRFLAKVMGAVAVAEVLRRLTMSQQAYSDAVTSVASFPILLVGGLALWRMGRLLRRLKDPKDDSTNYFLTVLSMLGRVVAALGIIGPLLAAFGYVTAGKALVFPAIISLGLLTTLLVLQNFLTRLWALLTRAGRTDEGEEGLAPVFFGFVLALASLPVFALIWGARLADLTELWTRFREGFAVGGTTISPTDFVVFAVVFAIGYLATSLVKGALRNTILPRTRIDTGGRNALVAGTGYIGIVIAAVLAITAAGIDLTGLAIVASALSVGVGFGLQTIVQNFVAGIILMIERPMSEGDWIFVNGTHGTVRGISVRSTRIQTFDRCMVVVPNADLVSQQVTNYTRFGLAGRLVVSVSVAWGPDSRRVEALLREIAEAQPMVVLKPPPMIVLMSLDADGMNFDLQMILRDINFINYVRNDVNHMIARRFHDEGIETALTRTSVRFDGGGPPTRPVPAIPSAPEGEDAGQGA